MAIFYFRHLISDSGSLSLTKSTQKECPLSSLTISVEIEVLEQQLEGLSVAVGLGGWAVRDKEIGNSVLPSLMKTRHEVVFTRNSYLSRC
jgi:hypothetical protein